MVKTFLSVTTEILRNGDFCTALAVLKYTNV